jgi:hypothetical protein
MMIKSNNKKLKIRLAYERTLLLIDPKYDTWEKLKKSIFFLFILLLPEATGVNQPTFDQSG